MADSRINASYTVVDASGKKSTKSLTDLSPAASGSQIAALVSGLVGLTTNTLSQIERVETTDITAGGLDDAQYSFAVFFQNETLNTRIHKASGVFVVDTSWNSRFNQVSDPTEFQLWFMVYDKNGDAQNLSNATISGYKLKGLSYFGVDPDESGTVLKMSFPVGFQFQDSEEDDQMFTLRIDLPATNTYKAATFYQHFKSAPVNMEAI